MANWAKAGMILGQGIKETGTMIGGLMIKAEEKRKDRLYAEKLLKDQRTITTEAASRKEKGGYFKEIYSTKSGRYDTFLKDVVKRLWPTGTTTTALGEFAATVVKLEGPERDALLAELEKVRRMAEKAGAKWYMHVFGVNEAEARKAIASELADFGKTSDQIKKALGKPQVIDEDTGLPDVSLFDMPKEGKTNTDQVAETILKGMKPGDFVDLFGSLDLFEDQKPFGYETYGTPAQEMGPGKTDIFEYRKRSFVDREKLGKVTLADLGEGEGSLRALFEKHLDVYKAGLFKAFQDRNITEEGGRLPKDVAEKKFEKMFPDLYSEEGKAKIFTAMLKNAESGSGAAQQAEQFSIKDPKTGEGVLDEALEGYNPQYKKEMLAGVNRQTPVGTMQDEDFNPEYTMRKMPTDEIYATQGGTVSVGEGRPQDPKYAGPLVEEGTYTYQMPPDNQQPSFTGSADMEPEEEAWAAFEAGVIEADEPLNIYSVDPQNPNRGEYRTATIRQLYPDRVAEGEKGQVTAPQKSGMINGQLGDAEPGMGSGIPKNWPVDKARHQTAYGADQRGTDVGLNFGPGRGTNPDPDNFVGWGEDITSGGRESSPDVQIAAAVPDAIYSNMGAPYEVQSEIPPLPDMPFDNSQVTSIDGVPVEKDEVFENPFRYSDIVPTMKNGVLFYDVHTERRDKPLGQMHAHMDNNPIGVDRGVNWIGLSPDRKSQGRLAKFDDPMYAYRAAARIIGRDYRDRGITTTEGIIREWLKSENEYRQYQDFDKVVSNYLKVIEDVTTLEADAEVATIDDIRKLLYGMTVEEMNGHFPYSMSVIREGIDNSGNWSFDKFKNRLALRPDAGSLRPSPNALYLLNEDIGGESIKGLPTIPEVTKEQKIISSKASEMDMNNVDVYVYAIIEGRASLADLEKLPPNVRAEVIRVLKKDLGGDYKLLEND